MLSQPSEILELRDGESITFSVLRWEKDEAIIRPAHAPQGKGITVLRVHVPQTEKADFPHYWDITSMRAIAQMLPHLERQGFERKRFTLTKHGEAPRAHFTLEVSQ